LVEALKKKTLIPNICDNAINTPMALNQVNRTFQDYTIMLNDFERPSMADIINDDILGSRLIKTYTISHSAKSVTRLTIVTELFQPFGGRLSAS
jgi:hypothetical protein